MVLARWVLSIFLCLLSSSAYSDTYLYEGYYICQQGKTALTLKVDFSNDAADAVFDFVTDKDIKGSFTMNGSFDKNGRVIELHGKEWIEQPGAFHVVGLKGIVSGDFKKIIGDVITDGCSTFEVNLNGGFDKDVAKKIKAREKMYKRLSCVTWDVRYSVNPFFKNTDIVEYKITGNMLDHADGQCEVRVKNQRRVSFIPGDLPYRNNDVMVLDCAVLEPCE